MEISGTHWMLRPELSAGLEPDGRVRLTVLDLLSPAAITVRLTRAELSSLLSTVGLDVEDADTTTHNPAPDDDADGPDFVLGGEGG